MTTTNTRRGYQMFTNTKFSTWSLKPEILSGLEKINWDSATEIQRDTIPVALRGLDVIGQARTGSGKTGAFGIPILNAIEAKGYLQALILCPTRELAKQVSEELQNISGDMNLSIISVYGGTDLEKQARQLSAGVDIIVGTPGRVMDMTKRGYIDMNSPHYFVLDEADRMLDMGFFPDIMWVLEKMSNRKQTLLFSATFPQEIIDAANEFMSNAEFVQTNEDELDLPDIGMFRVKVSRNNKLHATTRILMNNEHGQSIIFTNTKRMVDLLTSKLKKAKFDAHALHGDMNQNQREKLINSFKDGKQDIRVATDVAARGLDVDGISLVINYDVPNDHESFVHRIGRTGRIGREGSAWTLCSSQDSGEMDKIEAAFGIDQESTDIPELPSDSEERVAWQEDFTDSSTPFGYVRIELDGLHGSNFKLFKWLRSNLNCKEEELGDIIKLKDSTIVEVHKSKASLAMKVLDKQKYNGKSLNYSLSTF